MGNRNSTDKRSPPPDTLVLAMRVFGGDAGVPGYFGGARDEEASKEAAKGLREYEASQSAKAKEQVIRSLARALQQVGIKVDPEAEPDVIVAELVRVLPRPGGKSFKKDAEAHRDTCATVAAALNSVFTPGATKPEDRFIDVSLSAGEVCRQVGEWAHSFAAGVNTEYLGVLASVRNTLKSLEILDQVMAELYRKISEKVAEESSSKLSREVAPLDEVYRRAQAARKQQEELLKNLLHVELPPETKALEIAMQDDSDKLALVQRLGIVPGTGDFSDTLAAAVSGLGTAASVAQRVHKALKKIGLSVKQYLESPGLAELQKALDSRVDLVGAKGDLAEFLRAAETARSAFGNVGEPRFREALEDLDKTGGAAGDQPSFTKELKGREADKQLLVQAFSTRLGRNYDDLLAAIRLVGPELGRGIPLSDKTEQLGDALRRLRGHKDASRRIDLALIGVYSDAEAREHKEKFLSALRHVAHACEDAAKDSKTPEPLAHLKAACEAIEKTVDFFSDSVRQKFGGADADTVGGDASDLLASSAKNALSLGEAVGEFAYLYYTAKVRTNMAQTAKELESLGEKYSDLLGDAVAVRLEALATEKAQTLAYLGTQTGQPPFDGAGGLGDARLAAAKRWVSEEFDVKARFYNALQAVDLFLKAFASGIASDPDSMRSIKKILDGTQVIARWFSEKTGDALWGAFENMGSVDYANPGAPALAGAPAVGAAAVRNDGGSDHYYAKVGRWLLPGSGAPQFGIPTAGVPAAETDEKANRAAQARKCVNEVYDEFQALKNLVNAFVRIGSVFGGQDIKTKVFMSPTQMYRILVDYLKCSAMSINRAQTAPGPALLNTPASDVETGFIALAGTVRPWEVYFGSVRSTLGNYAIEDRLFARIVKAMGAKILVAVGVYDMLERTSPPYDLMPVRAIVGGSETPPEVIPEAAELYFRLPLLVEYYYQLFRWDGDGTHTHKIAMMPVVDGLFSGLIRTVFLKAVEPETGNYSDTEVAEIVREINNIYEHFARTDKSRTTQLAIAGLIADVNRRYGVVSKQEAQDYWKIVRTARTGDYSPELATNYSILPDEGEPDFARRAPSDRFRATPAGATPAATREELDISTALEGKADGALSMLRSFRKLIDQNFPDKSMFGKTSFAERIRQAGLELQKTSDAPARLAIVTRLISGSSPTTGSEKTLMFHESVVFGLNLLSMTTELLNQFENAITAMDPVTIEGAVMDTIYETALAGPGATINNYTQLRARMVAPGTSTAKFAAVAGSGGTTIFDRYIRGRPNLPLRERGGINADVTVQGVFRLVGRILAAIRALPVGGPRLPNPSSVTGEDPGQNQALRGNANAVRVFNALRLAARLLVRYDVAMTDFVETAFALGGESGGLAEVNIDSGFTPNVRISFSRLRSVSEATLQDVKNYIELLRPHIPKSVVERFEKSSSPGSVFWIEKNLADKRFRGDDDKTKTLEGIARRAGQVFANLTRTTNASLGGRITAAALDANPTDLASVVGNPPTAGDPTRVEAFGRAFSALLYYDALAGPVENGGLHDVVQIDLNSDPLGALIRNGATSDAKSSWAPTKASDGKAQLRRYNLYESSGGLTRYRSAMMMLNQLIAHFLRTFTGTPAGETKIYANLILSFANGAASSAVQSPFSKGFPDLAVNGATYGSRSDMQSPDSAIYSSLAAILRTLTSRPISEAVPTPRHLFPQLLDVPLFMKETMRANLPGFAKLFRGLAHKTEFIRNLMNRTNISLGRPGVGSLAGNSGAGVPGTIRLGPNPTDVYTTGNGLFPDIKSLTSSLKTLAAMSADHATVRLELTALAAKIGEMALSLASSSDDVLRELGDRPLYLQTGENSIEQFKVQNGHGPVMPHSLILWYLNNNQTQVDVLVDSMNGVLPARVWVDRRCLPTHPFGGAAFKLTYGTRGLLCGAAPPGLGDAPFTRELLGRYNSTSAPREQIEETRFAGFFGRAIGIFRYLTEVQQFRAMMGSALSVFGGLDLVGGDAHGVQYPTAAKPAPASVSAAFALGENVGAADVLAVVEETDAGLASKKVTERLGPGVAGAARQGRASERIDNLVDMNVIPVNVHALMRGIPLANVFNYEFTFDQLAAAMYGERSDLGEAENREIKKARQMFLSFTSDPFREIPLSHYGSDSRRLGAAGFFHRIFRGDNSLGMGRPKFASDQIFNKALFGSVYRQARDFDEGGPAVGIGTTRGREAGSDIRRAAERISQIVVGLRTLRDEFASPAVAGNASLVAALPAAAAGDRPALLVRARGWFQRTLKPKLLQWAAELKQMSTIGAPATQALWGGIITEYNNVSGRVAAADAADDAGLAAALDALLGNLAPAGGNFAGLCAAMSNPATLNSIAAVLRDGFDARDLKVPDSENWGQAPATGFGKITYLEASGAGSEIKSVAVGSAKPVLEVIGKHRFDSRIVRQLLHIVSVLRLVRLKINRELAQHRQVLLSSHSAVETGLMEYGADPFDPNESTNSTLPNGSKRFSDQDEDF